MADLPESRGASGLGDVDEPEDGPLSLQQIMADPAERAKLLEGMAGSDQASTTDGEELEVWLRRQAAECRAEITDERW